MKLFAKAKTKTLSMDEKLREVERLLNKDVLKDNLAKAGVYSVGWEFLQYSLIQRPKRFFTMARESDDYYKAEVLSRHENSPLIASCLWFKQRGVLTDADISDIRQLRKHRTDIAHQMLTVLLNTEVQVDEGKLAKLVSLLGKVDRWWLLEFEIPANEEFDGQEIDPQKVRSGQMDTLWLLIQSVYDLKVPIPPLETARWKN
jgi:hypothetical protein